MGERMRIISALWEIGFLNVSLARGSGRVICSIFLAEVVV